ncbi:MAG: hypothetical protein OXD32_02220 [Endozoicomonadaceae bacterium]|nr:hypothetical protein [Endozoicomonadaceae bacterium]
MPHINDKSDSVSKVNTHNADAGTAETKIKGILKKHNKSVSGEWTNSEKNNPFQKSRLEKFLSYFFKTPDNERNNLFLLLQKLFSPSLWFKETKVNFELSKNEVKTFSNSNPGEEVLQSVLLDVKKNEETGEFDAKKIIEDHFGVLEDRNFVAIFKMLPEKENVLTDAFKSLLNEYMATKVYNDICKNEECAVEEWLEKGDMSFRAFKEIMSQYNERVMNNLEAISYNIASLGGLEKLVDYKEIKTLIQDRFPYKKNIKQEWLHLLEQKMRNEL